MGWVDPWFFFFITYLFGCTRSYLQHVGSLIFIVACGIFSYSTWILKSQHARYSFLTRNWTQAPGFGSLSHWTPEKFPQLVFHNGDLNVNRPQYVTLVYQLAGTKSTHRLRACLVLCHLRNFMPLRSSPQNSLEKGVLKLLGMSFVGKCLSSLEIELNVEKMKSAGPVLLTFVIKDFFLKDWVMFKRI